MELNGIPLVRRSVEGLLAAGVGRFVITIPRGFSDSFDEALMDVADALECVVGGQSRQESVSRGLEAIGPVADGTHILIHDAARPMVPGPVVHRVLDALQSGARAVVPVVAVTDSIRRVCDNSSVVVDRSRLRAVQTPQGFHLGTLRRAHDNIVKMGLEVTDDAAACEALGVDVALVDGDRRCLKITEPVDLLAAEAILSSEGNA